MDSPQADGSDGSPPNWGMLRMPDITSDINNIHAANATCAAFHADVAAKHAASLAQWVQHLYGQIASLQGKVVELEDWKARTLEDMSRLRTEHRFIRKKLAADGAADDEEWRDSLPSGSAHPSRSRESAEDGATSPQHVGKVKSQPLLLADHVDPGSEAERRAGKKGKATSISPAGASVSAPPPGLGVLADCLERMAAVNGSGSNKLVRFAPEDLSPTGAPGPAVAAIVSAASIATTRSSADESEEPEPGPVLRGLSAASMLSEISHISDYPDEGLVEGVNVAPAIVDGVEAEVAQWRIGHLSTKLRGCMGRALVSSPFSMWGLQDLRLMVFPDGKEVAKGPRSRRQKELYAKKVSEGPLEGCLKLKVPDCPAPHILEYYLKIGSCRQGRFKHNFAESTVNGCLDFGIDWLKEVEPDQSLTVTVEVLKRGAVANLESMGAI